MLGKLRERIRDHTRDELCADLLALDIQAQMSERGRPEEEISQWRGRSLGIIDIQGGQIRWVDVKKQQSSEDDTSWYIEYGVPDSRITTGFHKVKIETIRVKTIPLIGKVVNLHWKGKDIDLGLIDRLSDDGSLNKLIMYKHDLEIAANPEHSCWIVTVGAKPRAFLSKDLWDCIQSIARHLLATPVPLSE